MWCQRPHPVPCCWQEWAARRASRSHRSGQTGRCPHATGAGKSPCRVRHWLTAALVTPASPATCALETVVAESLTKTKLSAWLLEVDVHSLVHEDLLTDRIGRRRMDRCRHAFSGYGVGDNVCLPHQYIPAGAVRLAGSDPRRPPQIPTGLSEVTHTMPTKTSALPGTLLTSDRVCTSDNSITRHMVEMVDQAEILTERLKNVGFLWGLRPVPGGP